MTAYEKFKNTISMYQKKIVTKKAWFKLEDEIDDAWENKEITLEQSKELNNLLQIVYIDQHL